MAVTASVATKAGLGLGALGAGATTVYFGGDYVNNFLSKYEKALIGFLNADPDNDFVFEVKKGGSTDLAATDIVFASADPQVVTVSVKAKVSTGSSSIFKNGNSDADTKHLQEYKH